MSGSEAGSDVITRRCGKPMFWNGHLCEGAELVRGDAETFCLWTRCGQYDVPANAAWEMTPEDVVTCAECLEVARNDVPALAQPHANRPDPEPH